MGRLGPNATKEDAIRHFQNLLNSSFLSMSDKLGDDGLLVTYYAHTSPEAWKALLKAGWEVAKMRVTNAFPLVTESAQRATAKGKLSLDMSIVVVWRKGSTGSIKASELYDLMISSSAERATEMIKRGVIGADLLTVDLFLFWVTEFSKRSELPPLEEEDFDHDEIRDMIKDIGEWLGFSAETEFQLERGARIDVVWVARIANLGSIKYAFEVHKRGSIDSLILNLQKASSKPDIQRVIAVSTSKELSRIEEEVKNLSDSFKRKLLRWNVVDVMKMHENLMEVIKGLRDLGLIL